jgi:hypothetical protein
MDWNTIANTVKKWLLAFKEIELWNEIPEDDRLAA